MKTIINTEGNRMKQALNVPRINMPKRNEKSQAFYHFMLAMHKQYLRTTTH